jgi:hypothetical protein
MVKKTVCFKNRLTPNETENAHNNGKPNLEGEKALKFILFILVAFHF